MSSFKNMDVLETILRSADADKYIENFRNNDIEPSSLKLLIDEDLVLLGVEDENIRKKILNHSKNLQIASEMKYDLSVDKVYAQIVLNQIYNQLILHHANLSCAVVRDDLLICDVQLTNASRSLVECIKSLEEQVLKFESKILHKKPKSNRRKTAAAIILSTSLVYILYKFVKNIK